MNVRKKAAITLVAAVATTSGLAAAPAHAAIGSCAIKDSNGVILGSSTILGNALIVNLGRGAVATGSYGSSPSLNDFTPGNGGETAAVATPSGRIPLRIVWKSNTGVVKTNLCYINA